MPSFAETASRIYNQLFKKAPPARQDDGVTTVLDGSSAIATVEAILADAASIDAAFPQQPGSIAWKAEEHRQQQNLFGTPLTHLESGSARDALAGTMGLALTGKRATVSLWSDELAAAQDLVKQAAGRHLPLVIHAVHRAESLQGNTLGSSHDALHALANSGAFILCAENVQQAVDFSLIARRVSEETLVPGIVVMDGAETAFALQNVQLPSAALIEHFVGQPDAEIDAPDEAQKLLFGEQRRRVPQWHDLDRPILQGALQDAYSFAAGSAAHRIFFQETVNGALNRAFAQFEFKAGRKHQAVSWFGSEKAKQMLIAQGSALETCKAVLQHSTKQNQKIGLAGVHVYAPFPTKAIQKQIQNREEIVVLERSNAPFDSLLLQTVKNQTDRNIRFASVLYGIGGLPLRAADLELLLENPISDDATPRYLGINPLVACNPKQEILAGQLGRAYPELKNRGIESDKPALTQLPDQGFAIGFFRRAENYAAIPLPHETATLLHRAAPGEVRSRGENDWSSWGTIAQTTLSYAPDALFDPGDEIQLNIAVASNLLPQQGLPFLAQIRPKGAILVSTDLAADAFVAQLPTADQEQIQARDLSLFILSQNVQQDEQADEIDQTDETGQAIDVDAQNAQLLGSLFALINQRQLAELRTGSLIKAFTLESDLVADTAFETALQGDILSRIVAISSRPKGITEAEPAHLPMAVRHLANGDENSARYDSLSRFWEQTGTLYAHGDESNQGIDPFAAIAAIPPLSSSFRNLERTNTQFPQFHATNCTGCGECWIACPDSAIGVTAISPAKLLDFGLKQGGCDALRPFVSSLSQQMSTLVASVESLNQVPELIQQSWDAVAANLPEDRRANAEAAVRTLKNNVRVLSVARTEPFFDAPEQHKLGGGELFTLAINPDSCKGCGICSAVCDTDALIPLSVENAAENSTNIAELRETWKLWEKLPDTSAETMTAYQARPESNPVSAAFLSKTVAMAMAGGDGAEAGSGEKIALRMALGITEYLQQPKMQQLLEEIAETREQLVGQIRAQLAEASHIENLSSLAESLEDFSERQIDLAALAKKTASLETAAIDAPQLQEQLQLARALEQEHQKISAGTHNLGRARYSLAIAAGSVATWAGQFPHNPFQVPTVIGSASEISQLAAGMLEGQLQQTTETFKLLRKAKLALKDAPLAEKQALNRLVWNDLETEEQQQSAPLFLIGNDATLGGNGLGALTWLLHSKLPVKVILLADLDLGFASVQNRPIHTAQNSDSSTDLAMLALSQRNLFVAQTSIANPEHLHASLKEALQFNGSALILVHAPSPIQHGFTTEKTLEQAQFAVASGALPLFRYHPEKSGVFGSRITLEEANQSGQSEQSAQTEQTTLAQWAFRENRFAAWFRPMEANDRTPQEWAEWITQDRKSQEKKTPVFKSDTQSAEKWAIDPEFARRLGQLQTQHQLLRELAGIETPFTAQVRQQVEAETASQHADEIAALKQAHQQELEQIRSQVTTEINAQIKARLVQLAKQNQTSNSDAGGV